MVEAGPPPKSAMAHTTRAQSSSKTEKPGSGRKPGPPRVMSSSGSNFKAAQSSTDVRAAAAEDLDKLSMGSRKQQKKKTLPKVLTPLGAPD